MGAKGEKPTTPGLSIHALRREGPPPKAVKKLVQKTRLLGRHLVIGSDANGHHTQWGSKDINKRGRNSHLREETLEVLSYGKTSVQKITGVITGHCTVGSRLHKIGVKTDKKTTGNAVRGAGQLLGTGE